MVSGPSERLPDHRSQAQIETRQRGLQHLYSAGERTPEPVDGVATQDDADEQAAREERERQERIDRTRPSRHTVA